MIDRSILKQSQFKFIRIRNQSGCRKSNNLAIQGKLTSVVGHDRSFCGTKSKIRPANDMMMYPKKMVKIARLTRDRGRYFHEFSLGSTYFMKILTLNFLDAFCCLFSTFLAR